MLILTIANITPRHLAERLEAAHIPATVTWSLGTCAPWPIERGATAYIVTTFDASGTLRPDVERFAADLCRDLGESCALLVEVPDTSALIHAAPKEG
jgi:hypothetical protein